MVSFAYWRMHLSELLNFRTPELLKTSLNTMHILVSRFSAFGHDGARPLDGGPVLSSASFHRAQSRKYASAILADA